jgi:acyl carrier protein
MPAHDRSSVIERLISWLTRANPAIAAGDFREGTDIIESRILESLQVVEFILFLEAESGHAILSEELNPDHLRTLESIYAHFFEERQ